MKGESHGTARAQVPVRFLDLSLGGALLVVAARLEEGAIHDFALDISGRTIWVQGEVRRCLAAERGAGFHIGVEFLGIDPQDQKLLQEFLARRH
jgi:c-di-GMP-binding flagellar brake protein YcgR